MFGQKGSTSTYIYSGMLLSIPAFLIEGLYGACLVMVIFIGLGIASHLVYLNDSHNIVDRFEKGEPLIYSFFTSKSEDEEFNVNRLTPEELEEMEDRRNVQLFRTLANFPPTGNGEAYDRGKRAARVMNGFIDYDSLPNEYIEDKGTHYCYMRKIDKETGKSDFYLVKAKYEIRRPDVPALGYRKEIVKEWKR